MSSALLLYGATGFVGEAIARLAVEYDLEPILAGRDAVRLEKLGEVVIPYCSTQLLEARGKAGAYG